MADKELRRLKRRELLQMLLAECKEAERLQAEAEETSARLAELEESYERLKVKLNVKDERLNQKDARIAELQSTIEEMEASKTIELEEAGSIAEAALRLNGIFETAQQCADQYLMNVKRLSDKAEKQALEEGASAGSGWRAGIRRRITPAHSRWELQVMRSREKMGTEANTIPIRENEMESLPRAASGDTNG